MHSSVRVSLGLLFTAALALPQALNPSTTPVTACQVSPVIKGEPPKDSNADAFGLHDWFVNADRTIWTSLEHWKAGPEGNKVIWIRPPGSELILTGRQVGTSKIFTLAKDRPAWYPTGFTVVDLIVPLPGCWEVTASAGRHELRFVTAVEP